MRLAMDTPGCTSVAAPTYLKATSNEPCSSDCGGGWRHAQRIARRHVSRVRKCVENEVYATLVPAQQDDEITREDSAASAVLKVLVAVQRGNPMHALALQALAGKYVHHSRTGGGGGEHLRHPKVHMWVGADCACNGGQELPVPLVYPAQNACDNGTVWDSSDVVGVRCDMLGAGKHGELAKNMKRGADRQVQDAFRSAMENIGGGRNGV